MDRRTFGRLFLSFLALFGVGKAVECKPFCPSRAKTSRTKQAFEVSRREFTHCGVRVQEIIIEMPGGIQKMIWCRSSIEDMVVDGRPNPCCHVDRPTGIPEDVWLRCARRRCQEGFDQYWQF